MTLAVGRIWDELHVEKDVALNFIAVFARFEYSLKRAGFLRAGKNAQPDWNCFAGALSRECNADMLVPVFACAAYLIEKPTKRQVVLRDTLGWEESLRPTGEPSLSWLIEVVKTTRNNLFHGGKFEHGPEPEPLRDAKLLGESTDVLLECLALDCRSARRVADTFWRFDAAG